MCNEHEGFVTRRLDVKDDRFAGVKLREFGDPQVAAELVLLRHSHSDVAIRTCDPQVVGRRSSDVPKDRRLPEQIPKVLLTDRKQGALRFDHQRGPRLIEMSNRERYDRRHNRRHWDDRNHLGPRQIFKVHRTRLYKEANGMDTNGWLEPGVVLVESASGGPEAILTADEWDAFRDLGSASSGRAAA